MKGWCLQVFSLVIQTIVGEAKVTQSGDGEEVELGQWRGQKSPEDDTKVGLKDCKNLHTCL